MLTRLQKANQLFKLQIEPVTPENIRAPVLEVSSLLTTVSPAADDDGRRPEAQLASSQPESIYDASSDAAQSASVRSVDSQPVSEVSTALTTPDMSDCEGKDNAASTSAQQPRPQPVVPTTQQLVVIARPASPVASRQQPKPRQPIKARLLGEAATQIKSDTPTPLIITSNLPSPKVKQRKGLVSSAAALTTTTTPAVPSSPPKKRKRDLPDTAPLPIPSPAVPLPQAKKRKPTPVDAAREDGSPEPYFKARIREMLTDPDHDDCVFEIPLQRRQRDMQRRQVEFRGFRKYQGTKNCPEMSGATGEPSGAEPKSHGKGKGKGKASAQTKAAPSVPTPNDGGIMLGALPGEPRWKKHIYHGPGGVNFW